MQFVKCKVSKGFTAHLNIEDAEEYHVEEANAELYPRERRAGT